FAPIAKILAVATLAGLSIASKVVGIPLQFLARFAALVAAALLAWIDSARARIHDDDRGHGDGIRASRLSVAIVIASLLAGGSLWQQRENFFIWPPMFEVSLCAVTGVLAVLLSTLLLTVEHLSELKGGTARASPAEKEEGRPLWAASLLALFSGVSIGLYMSLSALVAQNTAFEYPSRAVYAINAGVSIAAIGICAAGAKYSANSGAFSALRAFVDGPAGLIFLLAVTASTIGIPWILGTVRLVDFTTAGTLHVIGLVSLPLLAYLMLSRLAGIRKTGGYAALVSSLGGLGLVVGIAGYLVGGNTYNMDLYVGLAFTLLLGHGVMVAWLCKRPPGRARPRQAPAGQPGASVEVHP
ncbi:MAG: hypothetical protein JW839_19650, partial [Candidatus Lokiarchaeota archaeon]|nr:hypothetical protein [Candidatus Lokiarchaeota archaeon]